MTTASIRPDLLDAHHVAWRHVTSPGASWSGHERAALAAVALAALDDPDPSPPWSSVAGTECVPPGADMLPDAAIDAAYRLSRHAATVTSEWYEAQLDRGLDAVAYVELVGIVAIVAAVDGFYRAIGVQRPVLPDATPGAPSQAHPVVESATLNWVQVAAPADETPAVVQALSAAPAEFDVVRVMAAAQYIPFDEMGDHGWNRGTLARADMELVASRLSLARECFY